MMNVNEVSKLMGISIRTLHHYDEIGTEIEANTFLDNMPGEEKIPHHYSDEKEIKKVYDGYKKQITQYTYSF